MVKDLNANFIMKIIYGVTNNTLGSRYLHPTYNDNANSAL